MGGRTGPGYSDVIDKFAYGASSNSADVGNLTSSKGGGGHNTQN